MAYELPKMNTKSTPSRTSNMLTLTITPEIKACLATGKRQRKIFLSPLDTQSAGK